MRIWSLHPRYLDPQGLVALWRETLLAQKVLRGETKGYRHHPQLHRFQAVPDGLARIARYLDVIWQESVARGYRFDRTRVGPFEASESTLPVTVGQMAHEWQHLRAKLARRAPAWGAQWAETEHPAAHPLFVVVPGGVEVWERP